VDPAEVAFMLQLLRYQKQHLEVVGPATDDQRRWRWRVCAIEKTIELLQRPKFRINPFV
jgi:hypothetical protein